MSSVIKPRNLTARAAHRVLGNPASAGLDASVGNCFPGLEIDVRNLDGRFFPGLVFWVVTAPAAPVPEAPTNQAGIRLHQMDFLQDPMLSPTSPEPWAQTLLSQLSGDVGITLSSGRWYLSWIEQDGQRISCDQVDGTPYDGELVWRFLRCIAAEPLVTIGLVERGVPQPAPQIVLTGRRRRYTAESGVIDTAFKPGELTQSLCNPWQHDFRDCACYYWASNHPDVVLSASQDPETANTWLDWLRRDRSPAGEVAAPASRAEARPLQIDHFEINQTWQDLAFVIGGHEIGAVYQPAEPEQLRPYKNATEMIDDLEQRLAPLELRLAFEYLYSLFSLRQPGEVDAARWPTMPADLIATRQAITIVAIGEMTHLRWANQLLWSLDQAGLFPKGRHYRPILTTPPGKLRPLDYAALDDYIHIERPAGAIDRAYARCVATLEQPKYPRALWQLAVKIDSDGMDHFNRFTEMKQTLLAYGGAAGGGPELPYLRPVKIGTPAQTREALVRIKAMLAALNDAYIAQYRNEPERAQAAITQSRDAMDLLRVQAEALAAQSIGIPFFAALK
ncbi:ferritin-like domain-containing protein [Aquabacterium sp.]|uniref:ferritin-like domain-containing protein n=1 Tax=Aquabacterium sp. TaxID=1872578 RepID=UPI002D17E00C|nr:ferritin-like domain-containing protein [Aquabacterium sp.]HSW07612.1 ferritin-like domain-containing protein [Aquabacterium sp.]